MSKESLRIDDQADARPEKGAMRLRMQNLLSKGGALALAGSITAACVHAPVSHLDLSSGVDQANTSSITVKSYPLRTGRAMNANEISNLIGFGNNNPHLNETITALIKQLNGGREQFNSSDVIHVPASQYVQERMQKHLCTNGEVAVGTAIDGIGMVTTVGANIVLDQVADVGISSVAKRAISEKDHCDLNGQIAKALNGALGELHETKVILPREQAMKAGLLSDEIASRK